MKKVLLITCLFALASLDRLLAADPLYPVSTIPPQLLVHANAVKRVEEIRFEVMSLDKARLYRKVAFTILNEEGDKFAAFSETYDLLQSLVSIEGRLFDENGKKLRSLKQSDIVDRSATSSMSLADDNRVKSHNFYHRSYPYTVEYETEIRMNYTMYYPGWIALEDEHVSMEKGRMTVVLPAGVDFRYKIFNAKEPVISTVNSKKEYLWEMSNVAAIQREFAAPYWYEITPVICMAPVQFAVQGYTGNMGTWQDFGKFVHALKQGRDLLPDAVKHEVHRLSDAVPDTAGKVAALYDYLQKNTRYISVQLGIGGWQPFNAQYVATNRYGDCKALTNYMYALLKEAGIRSNYTLVGAGLSKYFFMQDFPSLQFNHAILHVPLAKDTIWLECTSQSLPTGYLSGFTSDRPVLAVDEQGGKLVRTPRYAMTDNLQERIIHATVDGDGHLMAEVMTTYHGRQEDNVHDLINGGSKEGIERYLKEEIDLPNYDLVSYHYDERKSRLPAITEKLQVKAGNYAQVTGKRLFIEPNLVSKSHTKLAADSTRLFDVEFRYEYRDIDSVSITVPEGYQAESLPADILLDSKFGRYSAAVKFTDNKLVYVRRMEQKSGRFPAKEYADVVKFYNTISVADRKRVVLVKK